MPIIIFFLSCSQNKKDNTLKTFIKVSFYKGAIDTSIPINCKKIGIGNIGSVKDTIIKNGKTIEQIIEQIIISKNSKEIKEQMCDMRIKCVIYRQNDDTTNLCLGENNCLMINDKTINPNNSLSYLIKSNIGYYNYFPKEDLKYFDELKGKDISENYMDLRRKKPSNGIPLPPN